jgi:hypothetical protein
MSLAIHLAKHLREVHFGGNWTSSSLKQHLNEVTLQQATLKVHSLNTIAVLVYHTNYYVNTVLGVLKGGPLTASDKYSFDLPALITEEDWKRLVDKTFVEAEELASLVENLHDQQLWENFADGKYGNIYRNIQGLIEHTHYHVGQLALIKKIILQTAPVSE